MPPRFRSILRYSRRSDDCIFLEYAPNSSEGISFSSSSSRASLFRMVRKLVSVPPSQRSLTYGMPQRPASFATASAPCRFVPTNSTRLPEADTCLRYFLARSRPRIVSRTSMMWMRFLRPWM